MSYETSDMHQPAKELEIRVALRYRWRAEMLKVASKRFPGHRNKAMTPEEAVSASALHTGFILKSNKPTTEYLPRWQKQIDKEGNTYHP